MRPRIGEDHARLAEALFGEVDGRPLPRRHAEGAREVLEHDRTKPKPFGSVEEELKPHGFARVRRSRILRSAAVAEIETKPSGDFEVTLRAAGRSAAAAATART